MEKYNISGIRIAPCLSWNVKSVNFSNQICPDAYFNRAIDISKPNNANGKGSFTNLVDYRNKKINKKNNYILFILESPHCSEFKDVNPHPANGKTGRNLCSNIGIITYYMSKYLKNKIYTAVVINPIQFQTSLGIKGKNGTRIKDFNWIRMWFCECNDFLLRIKSFIGSKNEVVAINFCTESANKKHVVSMTLKDNFPNLTLFECSHPSSWTKNKKPNVTIY